MEICKIKAGVLSFSPSALAFEFRRTALESGLIFAFLHVLDSRCLPRQPAFGMLRHSRVHFRLLSSVRLRLANGDLTR